MKISVTDHMKNTYPIERVTDTTTVKDLKIRLSSFNKVPAQHQRIIFNGKLLKDDMTIVGCGAQEGANFVMVLHLIGD